MNSQEIIDYVMNTPNNTNPAILKQMIEASNGGSGGGYDLVIKCQGGEYSLVQGSYADTLAKMQAGIPPVVIYCYDHYEGGNRINFYYMPVEGVTKMFDRDDIAVDLGNMQYLYVYEDGHVEFVDES